MSLIPELGHLYHDFSISNAYTALDAREQLRTRQINAREDKQLGKYSEVINKAKTICKKRREWEEETLKRQLRVIQTKTPSLDRGLKYETERLRRYESSLISRSSVSGRPFLQSSQWPSIGTTSSPLSYKTRNGTESSSRTYTSSTRSGQSVKGRKDHDSECQVNFMKRAERVTKELHKLYRRQRERKSTKHHLADLIRANNRELLMKARIFFKDTDATATLESLLSNGMPQISDRNVVTFEDDPLPSVDPENELEADLLHLGNNDSDQQSLLVKDSNYHRQEHSETESGPVSSTIANASDSDSQVSIGRTKWTEIFKTPELWKMYVNENDSRSKKKDQVSSLVTITAKYRRTMVR